MTADTPASRYLQLIRASLDSIKQDVPRLTAIGEHMADHLVRGGNLFTPQIGTYWPSEFGGRAGGLMGLKPSDYLATSENDVAFTTLPDPRRTKLADDARWKTLIDSPAQIVINGAESEAPRSATSLATRVQYLGGAKADEGPHPLAPLRPFDQIVRGWITAGEMIAACTRAGKMPLIWMSVWLEGALVRNAHFFHHHNVREPWHTPLFHDPIYVPPLAQGYVAGAFLAELEKIFAIVEAQKQRLATAADWMADAIRAKKRVSTVLVGHSYPEILEIPDRDKYPLAWLPSISDLQRAHPADLGAGEVAFHLGYAPVNVPDVQRLLDRGIRFIYTSPYGRPATLKDHPNLLWLDLPWRPADATVDVPGYSVRILPMSSSAHTIVYFSILSELAERMGWK